MVQKTGVVLWYCQNLRISSHFFTIANTNLCKICHLPPKEDVRILSIIVGF